jgi:hypothetical protein
MGELGLLGSSINGYGCAGVGSVATGVSSLFCHFWKLVINCRDSSSLEKLKGVSFVCLTRERALSDVIL